MDKNMTSNINTITAKNIRLKIEDIHPNLRIINLYQCKRGLIQDSANFMIIISFMYTRVKVRSALVTDHFLLYPEICTIVHLEPPILLSLMTTTHFY